MRLVGGDSGFKTIRDLGLCVTGLFICIYHVVTTPPADLSLPLLMFGGGLAGATGILKLDEKRNTQDKEQRK